MFECRPGRFRGGRGISGPLSHVRVLDLSRVVSGPWAGQVLADLGADVIKVERAVCGDDTRRWGPPWLKDADGQDTQESGYFLSVNRGKRSIEVDLSSPRGQEIIKALAGTSDILIENFTTGTLARYGLGYSDLKEINPRLIQASITGFGNTGPKRADVAYDFMIQAMGGLMDVTGHPDGVPGGGPMKVGVPIIDMMTGMYAAVSVLAALARRELTGEGDHIDIAMLDVSVAMLSNQASNFLLSGQKPGRNGNRHPNIQPQDVFQARDGRMVLAVGTNAQFQRLGEVVDATDWHTDARFSTNSARVKNWSALHDLIQDRLIREPVAFWVERLTSAKVPCAAINDVATSLMQPQVQSREMVRHIDHTLANSVPHVISPMRFQESPLSFDSAAPTLGEHSEEILAELGL